MILPDKKDAIHKVWLYRVLEAVADDSFLSHTLYFKGGTCAAMLGWLPRFSVDLDFDYAGEVSEQEINKTRLVFENVFQKLGLTVKDWSKKGLQYFLKYPLSSGTNKISAILPVVRNTLKVDASFPLFKSSKYESRRFAEIDRVLTCQTRETMFAHKLVAPLDRFEKTGGIAGRDIYDIHHFFMKGFSYNEAVLRERRKVEMHVFLGELHRFIEKHITDTVIREDLSSLLPQKVFQRISKVLKR